MSYLFRQHVTAISYSTKEDVHLGMRNGIPALIVQEVLLRDVRDVRGLSVLCQQVVEGLILSGADIFRDGLPPFLRIVEHRVHVTDDTPERIDTVFDDLPDLELRSSHGDLFAQADEAENRRASGFLIENPGQTGRFGTRQEEVVAHRTRV